MQLDRIPSWKLFWSTFFVSLFLFGSMFAGSLYFILNSDRETDSVLSDIPIEDHYSPKSEDNLTLVFLGCRESNELPTCYIVCKLDVLQNRCSVVSIPPNTLATVNVSEKTISEHYQYGGPQEAADACANLLLLDADAYFRLNTDGIRSLTDFFSGIDWTFTEDFSTDRYRYSAGKQFIDGNRMADLLLSETFNEKAELFSRFLSTHFSEKFTSQLDQFYTLFFEVSHTTLTRATLNKLDKPLHRFFRKENDKVSFFYLNGSVSGEVFLPEETSLSELRNNFSDQKITES